MAYPKTSLVRSPELCTASGARPPRASRSSANLRKALHVNGGELEQIQFLLGHASVLTTERYLGCKQNLEEPVNDRFGCLFSGDVDSR